MIYEFQSQLKRNPLGFQEDQNHDYCSYQKTSLKKGRQPCGELTNKLADLRIEKSYHEGKPTVLQLIQDDEVEQSKQICIADFLEEEENTNRMVSKLPSTQEISRETLVHRMPNFADFLQDEGQTLDALSTENPKPPQTSLLQLSNINQIAENKPEMTSQHREQIGTNDIKYYVTKPIEFLQGEIPKNVNIRVSFSYQSSGQTQKSNLFLGDHEVLQCIGSGNSFIFECCQGFVGYMEIIGCIYHLYIFTNPEDMSSRLHCSIKIERKLLAQRKFSCIKLQLYSQGSQPVKILKSRDPFINSEGKLELRISNHQLVRPSAFNCVIEDSQGRDVCTLLHTNLYSLNISHPFTVLLGCAVALARIDWSSRQAKLTKYQS